ncbi:MAG: glycosyltransferase family 2 protein [Hominisplanchenecus sp.]|nr:glycosyltransferase family 2 protein [Lachnospiraceae bacterium]MDY2820454.1 glycosyltransferase family 2 protein [Hominisplanchenecus sp.]
MVISVCIPCYRSAKTLPKVVAAIREEFAKHEGYEYQMILVNDGSPDNTFEVIAQLCEEDENIIGMNLSRNHGQASAKIAALRYATGDALVYMDDDGQHPAEGIFRLVSKVEEGYDVVYAHFPKKKASVFKKLTSDLHNKIAEWTGNKPKGIHRSSFVAWSRFALECVKNYHSPFPSAGAYLLCVTDKFANVEMEHKKRIEGSSGYTLKKLVGLWLNSFTNFSIVPLRLASFVGVSCAGIGFLFGIYVVIRKLLHPTVPAGYTSTIAILLFIGGMIMMMLGLLGEYIGRMYMILSNKPQYSVQKALNVPKDAAKRLERRDQLVYETEEAHVFADAGRKDRR